MHILELPSFFPPYGGLFCLDQSRALNTGDNTVRILANVNLSARLSPQLYFRGERNAFFMQMQGVEVMKHYMRGIPFFTRANAMWWLRSTERLVEKYMAKYGKPDIIHAHCCQWAGCAAFRVWRKHGIPYVITEHLSSELILKEYTADTGKAWQIPYVEEAYRNAALVIPVSGELVDDLKTIYRWDCKWQVVSNIVDTAFFGYRKRQPLTPRRPLRLCCIANFVVGKGYDVMFEAVRKYLDTTGDRVEIVVAGRFTDSDRARRLVESLGLEHVVALRGEVDKHEVLRILHDSDCMLLATRKESQGLALLEAMATGMSVITTDSVPECVRIEGGCITVPTDDSGAMARAIAMIRRESLNDCPQASRRVAETTSPQVIGKQLNDLFLDIVKGRK